MPWAGGGVYKTFNRMTIPYIGPGDVVSGATSWWGLRPYSQAVIGLAAIRLRRDSDQTESDFVTLSSGIDINAIIAFKGSANLFVTKFYDQVASNHFVQATAATQPAFLLNVLTGRPAIKCNNHTKMEAATFSASGTGFPWTFTVVTFNIGPASFNAGALTTYDGVDDPGIYLGTTSANIAQWYPTGTAVNMTAADSAWHSLIGVGTPSPNAFMYVDGVSGASATPGSPAPLRATVGLNDGGFGDAGAGTFQIMEAGIWLSAFTSGNATSMNSNQHTFWGF